MKILLSPDKFRGSLTAPEVCQAMTEGIRMVSENIEVVSLPMADGGEGTLDLLLWYSQGRKVKVTVKDPLFRDIEAEYGLSADGKTAFIEMATASGLRLLKNEERNPLKTSTFGTGQLIQEAINQGVSEVILGIGGSATNDAGIGMAAALGWQFFDENNQELLPIGENLGKICKVIPPLNPNFNVENLPKFKVACDVTNPLYGENGAAYIYAPQKGADEQMVKELDEGLKNISEILKPTFTHSPIHSFTLWKGAGAAGGLGFGCLFFLNGILKEGVKLLMDFCNYDAHLENVDLIITGEGKIDNQTLQGKLINGLSDSAKEREIPLVAICGTLDASPKELKEIGISYATSIINKPMDLEAALKFAHEGVRNSTYYIVNLLQK